MLRFLKELFGITETAASTARSATIALAELENWLAQQHAPQQQQLAEQLAVTTAYINQCTATVREKIQALQSAPLLNPDIPERAKDFMTGNREEYTRRVLHYLDTLALPDTAVSLQPFFEQHAQDAQEFTRGILRPFQILQEFFANETKEITALLAQAEQELLTLKALHESAPPDAYDTLRADARQLLAKQQQRVELHNQRDFIEKQRFDAEQSIRALNTEEERLLKDALRQTALQRVNEAHQHVLAHEQKIKSVFANLEPALRKFHRMGTRNIKLTERYVRDPVATLMEDLHLDILEIITDIKRLLQFDRLPVGDKKAYVLDAVQLLTKEHFGTWMREYGQLTKQEKDAQQAVENCEASKTLGRVQKLRDDMRRNLQLAEQRLAVVKKDLEKIKLGELKEQLEARTTQLTGTTVTITL